MRTVITRQIRFVGHVLPQAWEQEEEKRQSGWAKLNEATVHFCL